MEFVRWYSWPVVIGFIFCLMLNPVVAGAGFLIWLALILYLVRRWTDTPEH